MQPDGKEFSLRGKGKRVLEDSVQVPLIRKKKRKWLAVDMSNYYFNYILLKYLSNICRVLL